MFTTGILSLHLPYVAFIAFYLFYFLFPSKINTAATEKEQITEGKKITAEFNHQTPVKQQKANYYFQNTDECAEPKTKNFPQDILLKKITTLSLFKSSENHILSTLFFRPPPAL